MATASKRLTRKDLRQPDWFQTTSEKILEIYEENRSRVVIAIAAVLVLLLGIWGWQIFKERQDTMAAQEFTRAMTLYQSGKHAEAISAFEKVQAYRWSRYALLGHLYQAHSHLAKNELDKGLTAAQRFIAATKPNSFYRQMGLVTLASIEELQNQCKQAVEHYKEAEKISSAFRSQALLGKARCSEQIGDAQAAIIAYKEHLKDHPGSSVSLQIVELEAKLGGQAAGK
jgi:predicted negative regulator of RcsB-dependent stress response